MSKTHYRKVMKSNHLSHADLEDYIEEKKSLVFTISHVKQEYDVNVAGKTGNFNIAYFKENIKPLVLNATNAKVVRKFCGGSPFIEDWKNVIIELYIDRKIKLMGDTVSGVRIRPTQPRNSKQVMNPMHPKWEEVKEKVLNGTKIEIIRKYYEISQEDFDLLCL